MLNVFTNILHIKYILCSQWLCALQYVWGIAAASSSLSASNCTNALISSGWQF